MQFVQTHSVGTRVNVALDFLETGKLVKVSCKLLWRSFRILNNIEVAKPTRKVYFENKVLKDTAGGGGGGGGGNLIVCSSLKLK